ncbi:MAG: DnaB-like helicase C-terminal domain-containing protein [Bacillota bacterium]
MNPVELDKAILAAALKDPAALQYVAARVRPSDLATPQARAFLKAIVESKGANIPPQALDFIGDAPAKPLTDLAPLITRTKEFAGLREVRSLCEATIESLNNGASKAPGKALDDFLKAAAKVTVPVEDRAVLAPSQWINGVKDEVLKRKAVGKPQHLDLGYPWLTRALSVELGNLVIVGAETGVGKTVLGLNMAAHLGVKNRIPTLYLNTEMWWQELGIRLLSIMAGADAYAMRTGMPTAEDLARVKEAAAHSEGAALYISDALPGISIDEVTALVRAYRLTAGINVLVVDYIQRVDSDRRFETWEALVDAAKRLKNLAQELHIAVIMLAQLTDEQKLAGAKGMANEADALLLLERVEDATLPEATHRIFLYKSRHTADGVELFMRLDRRTLRMLEIVDVEEG